MEGLGGGRESPGARRCPKGNEEEEEEDFSWALRLGNFGRLSLEEPAAPISEKPGEAGQEEAARPPSLPRQPPRQLSRRRKRPPKVKLANRSPPAPHPTSLLLTQP